MLQQILNNLADTLEEINRLSYSLAVLRQSPENKEDLIFDLAEEIAGLDEEVEAFYQIFEDEKQKGCWKDAALDFARVQIATFARVVI